LLKIAEIIDHNIGPPREVEKLPWHVSRRLSQFSAISDRESDEEEDETEAETGRGRGAGKVTFGQVTISTFLKKQVGKHLFYQIGTHQGCQIVYFKTKKSHFGYMLEGHRM
jgi:hypothetical protein